MSEQNQTSNATPATPSRWRNLWQRRSGFVVLAVAIVSGFIGVLAANAVHFRREAFLGGHLMMMGGPVDAAEAEENAAWLARAFGRHVGATNEQKPKLNAIATATAKDLFPMREKIVAVRRKALELLRQPNISRDQIEALRAEQFANIDVLSKRIAQAIGDVTEVLTPDQRNELADDLQFFAKHWDRHRGEGRRG